MPNRAEMALKELPLGSAIAVVLEHKEAAWVAELRVFHLERAMEEFPLDAIGFRCPPEVRKHLAKIALIVREFMKSDYVKGLLAQGYRLDFVNVVCDEHVVRDEDQVVNLIYEVVACDD